MFLHVKNLTFFNVRKQDTPYIIRLPQYNKRMYTHPSMARSHHLLLSIDSTAGHSALLTGFDIGW